MVHAVYPGSFDPVTLGHMDIVCRAAKMFDKVTVAVARNYNKPSGYFNPEERAELITRCTSEMPNVHVDLCDGLLADYVRRIGANVVVKGLRAMSDFEQEFQQALINRTLNPDMETLFIASSVEHMYLSSSMVKQVGALGGDIRNFVPPQVREDIIKRILSKA